MTTPEPMSPITEDDIADYLVNTPDFFERHASLLATVQPTHAPTHSAVRLSPTYASHQPPSVDYLGLGPRYTKTYRIV